MESNQSNPRRSIVHTSLTGLEMQIMAEIMRDNMQPLWLRMRLPVEFGGQRAWWWLLGALVNAGG